MGFVMTLDVHTCIICLFVTIMYANTSTNPEKQCNFSEDVSNSALMVNCSYRHLSHFPEFIPSYTTDLNLSKNFLSKLHSSDLTPYYKLRKLDLSGNRLQQFDIAVESLELLDISDNLLSRFPLHLPKGLKELKIGHNPIHKLSYTDFTNLEKLKNVHLNNISVSSLPWECSKEKFVNSASLNSLTVLNLKSNFLTKVDECLLRKFKRLKNLSLAKNKLSLIAPEAFQHNIELEVLDLSENMITELHNSVFESLEELKSLSLHKNKLQTMPPLSPNLRWLDISFNRIVRISDKMETILYPLDVWLVGGNPLHCDCKMLWLKELYDTREYAIKYLNVASERFIPVCGSPSSLENDTWDVLADNIFVCDQKLLSDVDKIPNVDSTEREVTATSLKVADVHSTFVRLQWDIGIDSDQVFLSFHPFGKKHLLKKFSVHMTATSYTLKDLEPGSPYIICVGISSDSGKVDEDSCVEVITDEESPGITTENYHSYYDYRMYLYTGVISLVALFLSYVGLKCFVNLSKVRQAAINDVRVQKTLKQE